MPTADQPTPDVPGPAAGRPAPTAGAVPTSTAPATTAPSQTAGHSESTDLTPTRMPAVYLGHGAPPLVDDARWTAQLAAWAARLPRPRAILVVSAHWEEAPVTLGATTTVPLTYDFWGFPDRYYRVRYPAPGAPDLADAVERLLTGPTSGPATGGSARHVVARRPDRGLDHGAYVPLTVMYPAADAPVLQMSMPTLDPATLLDLGRRLRPLRDDGVLIMGSGFLTHGLRYLRMTDPDQPPPGWSSEFDAWAAEALAAGDVDALVDFRHRAPAADHAHPTVEHFTPLFVTLGAADDPGEAPDIQIEGYWFGLAKRSFQVR